MQQKAQSQDWALGVRPEQLLNGIAGTTQGLWVSEIAGLQNLIWKLRGYKLLIYFFLGFMLLLALRAALD